jgi:ribose transport system substrate-binding protein
MEKRLQNRYNDRPRLQCLGPIALACALGIGAIGCGSRKQVEIAFIPQTEGNLIWEAAHTGAETAAQRAGDVIYWVAPAREDDVEAQIALVEHVVDSNFQGLVLAPDQDLALMTPVRRALAHGIPTVIIGSPLPIPPGENLSYILNNDTEAGQLAAERVGGLLKGRGSVALLGLNPDIDGTMIRAGAFEKYIAEHFPRIRIVEKRMGSFNEPREQQIAEETLRTNPDLGAIVALMTTTTDGALSALDTTPLKHSVRVIGFDAAGLPRFDQQKSLDCLIQEDTRAMGQEAIELIQARLLGQSVPGIVRLHPRLITRENIDSPEIRFMLSQDWTLGRWSWSPTK